MKIDHYRWIAIGVYAILIACLFVLLTYNIINTYEDIFIILILSIPVFYVNNWVYRQNMAEINKRYDDLMAKLKQ